ncbi:helix-turn-helix transcriptional regulator [Archangium violaceum]|uniref:helix-turn-helix domain-containing protein n=1 Tax=Archangium TaxID=47 RepID=UPI0009366C6A|nr:helix-turn-helix transcriptional regulator [Archangium sp. Cb G35]OJT26487.1 transcriptional regulator [Archangium sp. Cb G35]WNG58903.1 helix-turn-helix domain-containing protein [Archangium gephyra]WPB81217.1 helix-turn-helix transcriptional regulator [Archangium gephyra]
MDHVEFGKYLSQQRELRGLSRDEVSQVTKISPSLIAALEEGQMERLPSRVFVVNYIRAYATVIGLAPEEAILRYEEVDKATPEPSPVVLERERRRRAWVALAVLLVVVLGVGAYVALVMTGKAPNPLAR